MADFTVSIEKLNNNNYGSWSARIKFYLLGQDLWDIVNGSDTPPPWEARSIIITSDTSTSTPTRPDVEPSTPARSDVELSTPERPEAAAQRSSVDALKKYKVKAGKAMYALTVAVEDEFLQRIKDARTPKEARK